MMPFSINRASCLLLISACWTNPRQCSPRQPSLNARPEEHFLSCWPTTQELPIQIEAEHLWVWHQSAGRLIEYQDGKLIFKDGRLHCFHISKTALRLESQITKSEIVKLDDDHSNSTLRWPTGIITLRDLYDKPEALTTMESTLLILP